MMTVAEYKQVQPTAEVELPQGGGKMAESKQSRVAMKHSCTWGLFA